MELTPRFVEFYETSEAKNDVEEFFMEIVIFIFEKLNKGVRDKNSLFSNASPAQVIISLVSNILINMIDSSMAKQLTFEQRTLAINDLLDNLKEAVTDSWHRVELIKYKDNNAH